jgi:hypothetical protein
MRYPGIDLTPSDANDHDNDHDHDNDNDNHNSNHDPNGNPNGNGNGNDNRYGHGNDNDNDNGNDNPKHAPGTISSPGRHRNRNRNGGRGPHPGRHRDSRPTPTSAFVKFEEHYPKVIKIHITGSWFNRVPKAEICFDDDPDFKIFRKMPDFRWLWRMLLLLTDADRPVPDYPSEIPESHWPEGYLRRRKRELNLFLMQCHSIEWIKESEPYKDCFLASGSDWKKNRNTFSKEMVARVKNKKQVYQPTLR